MKTDSLISVLIPLYNNEKYVQSTILSILNQKNVEIEIIVVDDGSTDDSLRVVQGFQDSRIKVYSRPNQGVSLTRNYALQKASGDYIAFIDSDDLWNENHLLYALTFFQKHPDIHWYTSLTTSDFNKFSEKKEDGEQIKYGVLDYLKSDTLVAVPNCSNIVIRKKVLACFPDLFPAGIAHGEDLYAWTRIACQFPVYGFSNCVTAFYRINQYSATGTRKHPRYEEITMMENVFRLYKSLETDNTHKNDLELLIGGRIAECWRGIIADTQMAPYLSLLRKYRKLTNWFIYLCVLFCLSLIKYQIGLFRRIIGIYIDKTMRTI